MNADPYIFDSYRREIAELERSHGKHYRRSTVIWVMMGIFPIIMSGTAINVAIPSIRAFFGAGHLEVQALASSFLASGSAAMLLSGGIIGRLGIRKTYRWLTWGFLISSLLAAALPASGMTLLLVLRVIQGFMAGVAQALAMIVMMSIFPREQRGRAIAFYGLGITLSPTIGPFVGGILTTLMGWQGVFVFSLPFSVLSLFVASQLLPAGAPLDLPRWIRKVPALYLLGFVSGLSATFLLWVDHTVAAAFFGVIGLAGLGMFLFDQARTSEQMLDFSLLRRSGVMAACLISLTYGAGLYGSTYLIPVFLQNLGGHSAWEAGTVLLPGGIVLAFALYLGGILTDRFQIRWILFSGLLAFAISNGAFLTVLASTNLALVIAFTVMGRVGLGLTIPSLNTGATRIAPEASAPTVMVLVNYFRQLGGTIGVGVVGLLLEFSGPALVAADRISSYRSAFLAMTLIFVPALIAVYWMRTAVNSRQ